VKPPGDFHGDYTTALRAYLAAPDEAGLAVGHELGRRALAEQVSVLEIIENHLHLVDDLTRDAACDKAIALQFLLQTLVALDVAVRGFLDGTKRYEQQRARAQDLADRDEFRTALVNSLQEGFFVADRDGAVIEINDAFADITGYGAADLPYKWPATRHSARGSRGCLPRVTWPPRRRSGIARDIASG
jgi:PAS domain-containing protein